MKIVDVRQGTAPWHAWRRQGVSASDVAAAMGLDEHKTPWRLWAEKTGKVQEEDLSRSPLIRRGKEKEKLARAEFERRHPETAPLLPICVEDGECSVLRASLDGITADGKPVELKCPHPTTFSDIALNGTRAPAFGRYQPQVQAQLACTGASTGILAFYCDERDENLTPELMEFEIQRDDAFIEKMKAAVRGFWEQVKKRKPPEKDPERDFFFPEPEQFRAWEEAAVTWVKCQRKIRELSQAQKKAADDLVRMMGKFTHADALGISVTRFMRPGPVDYQKLLKERLPELTGEELAGYRKKAIWATRIEASSDNLSGREASIRLKAIEIEVSDADEENQRNYGW